MSSLSPLGRNLILLGMILFMLGLLTGFVSGTFANPRDLSPKFHPVGSRVC